MSPSYPNNPPDWSAPTPPRPIVEVPVKSALSSKINWTNAIAAIVALAAAFGYTVPGQWSAVAATVVSVLSPVLTIVFKTWFTRSVTKQSAEKM